MTEIASPSYPQRTQKEQSLLFDLFNAFDLIEINRTSDFFSEKKNIFRHVSELPSGISFFS